MPRIISFVALSQAMALSFHTASLSFAGAVAPVAQRAGAISMETVEDLKAVRAEPSHSP